MAWRSAWRVVPKAATAKASSRYDIANRVLLALRRGKHGKKVSDWACMQLNLNIIDAIISETDNQRMSEIAEGMDVYMMDGKAKLLHQPRNFGNGISDLVVSLNAEARRDIFTNGRRVGY